MESLIGRLAETQFGAFLGNLIGRMHLSLSVVEMDLVVLAAHFEPRSSFHGHRQTAETLVFL